MDLDSVAEDSTEGTTTEDFIQDMDLAQESVVLSALLELVSESDWVAKN